ncbi:uncharacterized protein K02A2.6-like [Teleopsis dalmanni]|uniref:uncharacterized protein K02A2.6-like n=1 Tax=Teleopsis dalmanni TaxID=139649 RepID=UPI0018CDA77C|nr:uncharacterized protein K02A2.6-like [Teleopsis dalmanni]XP_037943046.1 uncharacterized protein K02A2.6-like [Teleopsis dalmanni]XP_037944304.1 uncharacterized protein K02A2.6-like [Teleopsis dalmanni]
MREIFATHGIPDTIVSDNRRTFVSEEFEKYLKLSGIKHIRTAPYHPSSNGQAERFVQTIKNHLKKMQSSDINKNLANILLHLRTTPNANSNSSPAEILMGRKLKTLLDHLHPSDDNTQKQLNSDEYSKQIKPVRSFQCSESVWYRNFGRGEK